MIFDAVLYALLRKYIANTLKGAGALKGASCQIQSIARNLSDDATVITFKWENNAGEITISTAVIPDGKSANHFMTKAVYDPNGEVAQAGGIPEYVEGEIAKIEPSGGETGQLLIKASDTDYDTEWASAEDVLRPYKNLLFELNDYTYIGSESGSKKTTSGSQWKYSNPISVTKGQHIKFTASGFATNVAMISTCSSDGEDIVPKVISENNPEGGTNFYYKDYEYDVTSDGYIVVSCNSQGGTPILQVKSGSLNIDNVVESISFTKICNSFKKVVCVGDSFTAGMIYAPDGSESVVFPDYSWVEHMGAITGNNWVNCGVSGATSKTWQTNINGLPKAQAEGLSQAYVIGLGINDSSSQSYSIPVGTVSDIGTDNDTYYAQLSKVIVALATISPDACIFVNTCPHSDKTRIAPYNSAIKDIVSHYSGTYNVYCVDLAETYAYMYYSPNFTSMFVQGHPTVEGHSAMASMYAIALSDYIKQHEPEFRRIPWIDYDEVPNETVELASIPILPAVTEHGVYNSVFGTATAELLSDGSVDFSHDTTPTSYSGAFFEIPISTLSDNTIVFTLKDIVGDFPGYGTLYYKGGSYVSLGMLQFTAGVGTYILTPDVIAEKGLTSPIIIGVTSNFNGSYNVSVTNSYGDGKTVLDLKNKTEKSLSGKNAVFLGDSITAATGNRSWVDKFCVMTGCKKVANVAVGGAYIMDSTSNPEKWLSTQVQSVIDADYDDLDLIIISIGTNIGITARETYIINALYVNAEESLDIKPLADVDRTSSEGAFRWCCESLHNKYPDAVIVWCSPINKARTSVSVTAQTTAIVNYDKNLETLTAWAGVNHVHTNRCGITIANEKWSTQGEYLIDGLHPNEAGAWKVAKYNAAAISKLFV